MTCDTCGQPIGIGDWPFCPHGPARVNIIDDAIEGGPRHFETMGPDAPYIETKSQWRREVAKRNLVQVDRHDAAYHRAWFTRANEERRDTARNRS